MSETDWERLLVRTWSLKTADIEGVEALLLAILGFRRLNFDKGNLCSVISRDHIKHALGRAAHRIDQLLAQNPSGLTLRQITHEILASPNVQQLNAQKIRILLRSKRNLRCTGGAYYLQPVLSRPDQYYEILKKAGRPLHYHEIARRLRQMGYPGRLVGRSVTNRLCADARFNPVSMTGFWALAEWEHVETRSIADIAFEEIKQADRPLDAGELYRRINNKRPARRDSLRGMLSRDARFERPQPGIWALKTQNTEPR
jgi:hypothetical protein